MFCTWNRRSVIKCAQVEYWLIQIQKSHGMPFLKVKRNRNISSYDYLNRIEQVTKGFILSSVFFSYWLQMQPGDRCLAEKWIPQQMYPQTCFCKPCKFCIPDKSCIPWIKTRLQGVVWFSPRSSIFSKRPFSARSRIWSFLTERYNQNKRYWCGTSV